MAKRVPELCAFQVRKIKKPGRHFVGGVAGLHLLYRKPTAQSWMLRVGINGKRCDLGLGSYPEITLEKARERARDARDLVWKGINPLDARRQAAEAEKERGKQEAAEKAKRVTFETAALECWKTKEKEFKNPKHAQQWINTLREYAFPTIGTLWVQDVERAHVLQILLPIWETKTETATRVRGRIENVLTYSKAAKYRVGDNAAAWPDLKPLLPSPSKLKKRKKKHFAALHWERMPEFIQRLRQQMTMAARCKEFTIQTTSRSSESRNATWSQVDMERREWRIPGDAMKAELPHRVPLNDAAMRILKSMPRVAGSDLIFTYTGKKPLSENTLLKCGKSVAATMEGKPKVTTHGFRSSFKDWARNQPGHEDEVSELALAHVNSDETRAAYARDELMPKRRILMHAWGQFCEPISTADNAGDMRAAA